MNTWTLYRLRSAIGGIRIEGRYALCEMLYEAIISDVFHTTNNVSKFPLFPCVLLELHDKR